MNDLSETVTKAIDAKWKGFGKLAIGRTVGPDRSKGRFVARVVNTQRASGFTMLHTYGRTYESTLLRLLGRIEKEAVVEICEIDEIAGHPV